MTDDAPLTIDSLVVDTQGKRDTNDLVATVEDQGFGDDDDFEFGDFTEADSSGEDESHQTTPDSESAHNQLRMYQTLLSEQSVGGREAYVAKLQDTEHTWLPVDTSTLSTLDSLERQYPSLLQLREPPVASRQGYGEESVFRQRLMDKLHLIIHDDHDGCPAID